jgi:N-methylhydantoinase B/oxoprolinase/acetone carboxylase alpha subunit
MSRRLDPGALQVLLSRLSGIAGEMGAVLRRAAFSPNIKERADCSAALFTPGGELLAQAEHIPVHLGSMPASVAAAIEAFGRLGRPPEEGDQLILNDPFSGGTHLNDVTLVAPCILGGRVAGWVANRAHHADVGGSVAGSIPAEADEIYEEGLRLPPVLLTPEVRDVLAANSRTPVERVGDLDAQVGANRVGAARMAEVAGEGADWAEVCDYGERRMRAALAGLPDGSWEFSDVLEPAGAGEPERSALGELDGARPRIAVLLTVQGDAATFDFTGTDPQQPGNLNAVEAVTVSAVGFALRCVTDPSIPPNGGALRPVTVIAPSGSLVACQAPSAVAAGNVEVSQRIADVCIGALAKALPGSVGAAGQGTMNNVMVGGRGWVYYETVAGGQGGRPGRRGMNGVHTGMTNTMNTPVEALERAYTLRVRRYRLRDGSGGAGRWPGGDGIERDLEVLEAATVSLVTERRSSAPWGARGGGNGAYGENWLLRGGDESSAERLPARATVRLEPGDVVRVLTPGGGGYGRPPA